MLFSPELNLRRQSSTLDSAEEEYNEDFNPGAGDRRSVGVPNNGLRATWSRSSSLDRHRLDATSMSTRHDFVFAAPRPNHEGFTQQYF
jgi:hypothetical protein